MTFKRRLWVVGLLCAASARAASDAAVVAALSVPDGLDPTVMVADSRQHLYLAGFATSNAVPASVTTHIGLQTEAGHMFIARMNVTTGALDYLLHLHMNRAHEKTYCLYGACYTDNPAAVSGIAVDAQGEILLTGNTSSTDFPSVNAEFVGQSSELDAFALKVSADGRSLVYSTYLGGRSGKSFGVGVVADAAGAAYVGVATAAADFPVTRSLSRGAAQIVVVKLSPSGSMEYATRTGGSATSPVDRGSLTGIAVDGAGQVLLVGPAHAIDWPTSDGAYQPKCPRFESNSVQYCDAGFVVKLAAGGRTAIYSTYLDLVTPSGVSVDGEGNAIVVGTRPLISKAVDRIGDRGDASNVGIVRLSPGGAPTDVTTFGGSGRADSSMVPVDLSGRIWLAGNTSSGDLPLARSALDHHPDGPLFRTDSAGDRWTGLTGPATFRRLALERSSGTLYGVSTTISKSTDNGATWQDSGNGLPTLDPIYNPSDLAIDPGNPQTLFLATAQGTFRSTNAARTWTLVDAAPTEPLRPTFVAVSPVDHTRVWTLKAGGGVRVSDDGGNTWVDRTAAKAGGAPTALAPDALNRDAALAMIGSDVYRTDNAAETWSLLATLDGQFSGPFQAYRSSGRIYASGGSWRSDDGGRTWRRTNIAAQLASQPYPFADPQATALEIDPSNPDVVYEGVRGAILKTTDGGGTWQRIGPGLTTHTIVFAIAADPAQPKRIFATSGLGTAGYVAAFRPAARAAVGASGGRASLILGTYLPAPEDRAIQRSVTASALDPAGTMYVLVGLSQSNQLPPYSTSRGYQLLKVTMPGAQ